MILNLLQLREGENPVTFTIEADALRGILRLVDDLYDVPQQALCISLSLWRSHRTVTMKGAARPTLHFRCARCLDPARGEVELPLDWTLLPKKALSSRNAGGAEGVELQPEDLNVSFVDVERVDLVDLVREALLLEVEPCPRCSVDTCAGSAYIARPSPADQAESGPAPPRIDPRWAALAELRERLRDKED